jgi:hypothetical protein
MMKNRMPRFNRTDPVLNRVLFINIGGNPYATSFCIGTAIRLVKSHYAYCTRRVWVKNGGSCPSPASNPAFVSCPASYSIVVPNEIHIASSVVGVYLDRENDAGI